MSIGNSVENPALSYECDLTYERDELLEVLKSTLRIVEALSYHTQLRRSQREQLDKAKALIARLARDERRES